MRWLDVTNEETASTPQPASSRRGPPRLPGMPEIPPMPVVSTAEPAPTNKTIEVDPQWLEQVEQRRQKKAEASAAKAPTKAPAKPPPPPATAARPRPPAAPIRREDD